MFPENAPPLCKKFTMSPGKCNVETSGQGLVGRKGGRREAKTHQGIVLRWGNPDREKPRSYGLGQSTRRTSFVRDCSDSEFTCS